MIVLALAVWNSSISFYRYYHGCLDFYGYYRPWCDWVYVVHTIFEVHLSFVTDLVRSKEIEDSGGGLLRSKQEFEDYEETRDWNAHFQSLLLAPGA